MSGIVRIYDQEFQITQATVGAKICDPDQAEVVWGPRTNGLSWHLSISAAAPDENYLNMRFYCENFILSVDSWTKLAEQQFEWLEKDTEFEQNSPRVVDWGHNDVLESVITFGAQQGNGFEFHWRGICALQESIPFSISTFIEFVGVNVHGPDVESAKKRLAQHFPRDTFHEPGLSPISYLIFKPVKPDH